jgi:hypothetical protein
MLGARRLTAFHAGSGMPKEAMLRHHQVMGVRNALASQMA